MPSSNNNDNFLDKAFTVIAEGIVKMMPIAAKEKQAEVQSRIDDAKERAREAEIARKEAEKEREAERQEREDLKDQEITQSKEDKKRNDQKRMGKDRIPQKRREAAQHARKET